MLRGRASLASVLLCFISVPVLTQGTTQRPCSHDTITNVRKLIGAPELKLLDCRLYTPTITDFENCPFSTLNCFADEVNVISTEFNNVKKLPIKKVQIMLRKLANLNNKTESACLQCERHREERVERFLQDLLRTLQQSNNKNCGSSG